MLKFVIKDYNNLTLWKQFEVRNNLRKYKKLNNEEFLTSIFIRIAGKIRIELEILAKTHQI